MRLWHKDLIPFLPRQHLLGQWRECCLIARQIATNGTPNHILVNRVMDYPIGDFIRYGRMVYDEMDFRGYSAKLDAFEKYFDQRIISRAYGLQEHCTFANWHDDIYLRECLYNLEEKYRAGGIARDEWDYVYGVFRDFTPLIY